MRLSHVVAYLAGAFSLGIFAGFNNYTLSLWLSAYTSSYLLIGLFGNTRSFEGAIASPIVGAWSDRTWLGFLGRRRPFILVGGLSSALLLAITPVLAPSASITSTATLWSDVARLGPVLAIIFLFTLTYQGMDDTHKALLADLTEGSLRDRLSALRIVVEFVGQIVILVAGFVLWSDGIPDWAFAFSAALMAAGVIWIAIGVPEPRPDIWQTRRPSPAVSATRSRFASRTLFRQYPGVVAFCFVSFAYWSGVNAVLPLVSVYTRDILGASVGEAQLLPALLVLSTMVLAVPIGMLGARVGRRLVMSAGFAIMAVAGIAGILITTREQGAAVFLLVGAGNAAILVMTIPILADLLPRHHMGIGTGILAASGSIAAPLASVASGVLADIYGPRAIFALMTTMTCIALAAMPLVRPPVPEDVLNDPGKP